MKKAEIHFRNYTENLKEKFPKIFQESFLSDPAIQIMLSLGLVLLIASWITAFLRFQPTEFDVPLKYDSFLGVTSLGKWYELYKFPLFESFAYVLNTVLADKIFKKDKMIAYILVGANIFITIIVLIIIINFSLLGF